MRLVACDLCDSSEVAVLFTQWDSGASHADRVFRVVECRGCGLIYLNPRPEGSELAGYYSQNYYDDPRPARKSRARRPSLARKFRTSLRRSLLEEFYHYPGSGRSLPVKANGLLSLMQRVCLPMERFRLKLIGREAALIPFIGKDRLLDVGCGTGKALAAFKELGWDVSGVEISPYAAAVARSRLGCEISVGDFEQTPLPEERFDVIRFCHSLEHLPSPRRALEKASRLLRPTGLLWIDVPTAASLERVIFGRHWFARELPRHLYHFTPNTLAPLLACTGFRSLKFGFDGRALVLAESISNVLGVWLGSLLGRSKLISAMGRPLTLALGLMQRASILFAHAEKDLTGQTASAARDSDRWSDQSPR